MRLLLFFALAVAIITQITLGLEVYFVLADSLSSIYLWTLIAIAQAIGVLTFYLIRSAWKML